MQTLVKTILFSLLSILLAVDSVCACTCFCFDAQDGPVFGFNLDLFIPGDGYVFINKRGMIKEGFEKSTTGVKAKWTSKYGSVTFNLVGREWALGGMNEAGLVVGSMELLASEFPEPDERPPLYIGVWTQYVLDTCGSIEDVLQLDSKVRIQDSAPPLHFLIADATGNCAAIEYLDGKFVCRSGGDLPVKAMSNMRYDRALAALEMGGPRWWWSNPGQSAERFAAAEARNKSFDADGGADAIKYAFETLTRVVAASHTKWNMVFDVSKREVWYRSVQSPKAKRIALRDFDFSCETPLLMLDVNASLEGDVKDSFTPYDPDANLSLFRTFCARYGIEISEEDAKGLMRHINDFKCSP